jgi:hypothetical protein
MTQEVQNFMNHPEFQQQMNQMVQDPKMRETVTMMQNGLKAWGQFNAYDQCMSKKIGSDWMAKHSVSAILANNM